MNYQRIKYSSLLTALALLQATSLLFYLNVNIVNVGAMGTALPVLVAYVGLSVFLVTFLWLQKILYVRLHLFLFFLLVAWIAFRIVVDMGDMEYLKQITIATTGGILLFYVSGALLGASYQNVVMKSKKAKLENLILFLFFCFMIWMLYEFSQRLHSRLFYLTDLDGAYQRPGNFLSISFIVASYFYLLIVLKRAGIQVSALSGFFWLVIYTLSALMALVGSQLFGSNSATAVIMGVYLITLVMALIVPRKRLWLSYLKRNLALPWSKRLINRLFFMALIGLLFFVIVLIIVVSVTGFDITNLRLLGFGSVTNTSIQSRIEILTKFGETQLSYAPLFGNINVAYLTTGNAGRTLHSFFPYVMANLGLVGLSVVLTLFSTVLMQLYKGGKIKAGGGIASYQENMIAIYSIFVLLYLIFFANLATGVSWAVLWFTLGFISKPFGFKQNEKHSYKLNRVS